MDFQVSLEWIRHHPSIVLIVIIISIAAQFGLIILLMIYILFKRFHQRLQTKRFNIKIEAWYEPLFGLLENQISIHEFARLVPQKDKKVFALFIKDFFLDLAGEEKEKLKQLMIEMDINGYMISKLESRNKWERLHAVYFLGLMNCQQALPKMRQMIYDSSDLVRLMAVSNLMQLKDLASVGVILDHLGRTTSSGHRNQVSIYLIGFGQEILPHLESILENTDLKPWIQEVCIELFGYYSYLPATDKIQAVFAATPESQLKITCVASLAKFEDPSLTPFFENLLSHDNPVIVMHAASALGKIGESSSLPALSKLAASADFWVAKRSIEAILQFHEPGHQFLDQLLATTQSPLTRDLIIEAQTKAQSHKPY